MCIIGWLDDAGEDTAAFGGKGASLAGLIRAGFTVPAGFCVRAPAYHRFIEANGLADAIRCLLVTPNLKLPKTAREACGELTRAIESSRLPDDLAQAICAALAQLRRQVGPEIVVAVRSSALSEDATGASSAGLYETYLNLRDDRAVLDAVLACYASLWTPRAVQYRAFKGIDSAREAMAVVVMEMVPSDVSGVAFTVNPVTGARDQITVNASWGLGEAVVSGLVTPDQFLLDKATLAVLSRDIHPKDLAIQPAPAGASGTVRVEVPPARAYAPALSDRQIRDLGEICRRIEQHYGRPVDVEWAFARGRLFILQTRPVTGLRDAAAPAAP
jgi:phosphoenolpyruvate synthase/pyruvate phosphate dikinase